MSFQIGCWKMWLLFLQIQFAPYSYVAALPWEIKSSNFQKVLHKWLTYMLQHNFCPFERLLKNLEQTAGYRRIIYFMVDLWNRADHIYFHAVLCSSFFFFLAKYQPPQIGCLPYFHTWCGLSANLRCRYETCCTRLAENTGRKVAKSAIWAPSHNFVGLYLCN